MTLLFWFPIGILAVWSYVTNVSSPSWAAVILWLIVAVLKIWEKRSNYRDWLMINHRDESNTISDIGNDFAKRGLFRSGMRMKKEEEVKQNFEFERKRKIRRLWVEIFESLTLR